MRLSFPAPRQGALAPPWAVCSPEVPPNKEGLSSAPGVGSSPLAPPLHKRALLSPIGALSSPLVPPLEAGRRPLSLPLHGRAQAPPGGT